MTMYIRLIFEASYSELCQEKDQLRDAIVRIFKKYAERWLITINLYMSNTSSFKVLGQISISQYKFEFIDLGRQGVLNVSY